MSDIPERLKEGARRLFYGLPMNKRPSADEIAAWGHEIEQAALKAENERLKQEHEKSIDDLVQERLDEMSADAASFDKTLWKAIRAWLEKCPGFRWENYDDCIHADEVVEFLREYDRAAEAALKAAQRPFSDMSINELQDIIGHANSALAYKVLGDPRTSVSALTPEEPTP